MNDKNKCDHKWRSIGLWDGENPDGLATGGQLYECDSCKERAQTLEEIKTKGGTIIKGTNIYGKPLETK